MSDDRRMLELLADDLWAQRHATECLLFKLVTAGLLLSEAQERFVPAALDEVDQALVALHRAERRRIDRCAALADLWDLPVAALTLRTVAQRSPVPLDEVLHEHREALTSLAEEVRRVARSVLTRATARLAPPDDRPMSRV